MKQPCAYRYRIVDISTLFVNAFFKAPVRPDTSMCGLFDHVSVWQISVVEICIL